MSRSVFAVITLDDDGTLHVDVADDVTASDPVRGVSIIESRTDRRLVVREGGAIVRNTACLHGLLLAALRGLVGGDA